MTALQIIGPSIVAVVSAISDSVAAGLLRAKFPPLTDGGGILLTERNVFDAGAPPRVAFRIATSDWAPRATAPSSAQRGTNERRQMIVQRAIWTEVVGFEVHVIGPAAPADSRRGFDLTRAIYLQVIRSLQDVIPNAYGLEAGHWTVEHGGASQLAPGSKEFVFGVGIKMPVPDDPLFYVPEGTTMAAGVSYDGSNEVEQVA